MTPTTTSTPPTGARRRRSQRRSTGGPRTTHGWSSATSGSPTSTSTPSTGSRPPGGPSGPGPSRSRPRPTRQCRRCGWCSGHERPHRLRPRPGAPRGDRARGVRRPGAAGQPGAGPRAHRQRCWRAGTGRGRELERIEPPGSAHLARPAARAARHGRHQEVAPRVASQGLAQRPAARRRPAPGPDAYAARLVELEGLPRPGWWTSGRPDQVVLALARRASASSSRLSHNKHDEQQVPCRMTSQQQRSDNRRSRRRFAIDLVLTFGDVVEVIVYLSDGAPVGPALAARMRSRSASAVYLDDQGTSTPKQLFSPLRAPVNDARREPGRCPASADPLTSPPLRHRMTAYLHRTSRPSRRVPPPPRSVRLSARQGQGQRDRTRASMPASAPRRTASRRHHRRPQRGVERTRPSSSSHYSTTTSTAPTGRGDSSARGAGRGSHRGLPGRR